MAAEYEKITKEVKAQGYEIGAAVVGSLIRTLQTKGLLPKKLDTLEIVSVSKKATRSKELPEDTIVDKPELKAPTFNPREEKFLKINEVAAQLQVNEETIRRWCREGRLKGTRPGGNRAGYRIAQSSLNNFMSEHST